MKNLITHVLFGLLCVGLYAQLSKAEVVVPPEPVKVVKVASDDQCITWLFQGNLAQAKERVCGRKVK